VIEFQYEGKLHRIESRTSGSTGIGGAPTPYHVGDSVNVRVFGMRKFRKKVKAIVDDKRNRRAPLYGGLILALAGFVILLIALYPALMSITRNSL
jgi:hypothetical protein